MLIADFRKIKEVLPIITSKEIYVQGNTEKFHPEGLYSEVQFGSKKPYQCSCGALNHKSTEGETCDLCGVTSDDGTRRKEQYAKIVLRKKILLPIFEPAIRTIFGIKAIKDIFSVAKYKNNLVEPFYFDVSTYSLKKKKNIKTTDVSTFDNFPIYDITSLSKLYEYLISDPLYRPGIESHINSDHFPFVFTDTILVYPPETRPIVMSGQKKDIPEISKFYKKLITITNGTFWDKNGEDSEEYNKNVFTLQKIVNEMYDHLNKRGCTDKTSTLRESINGATVEYSGRSTIIPEPALRPYGIGLSADTVKKIFIPNILHYIYKKIEQPRMLHTENKTIDPRFDVFKLLSYINSGKFNLEIPDEFFEQFLIDSGKDLLCYIERAPVLWRFNFSGVILEVVLNERDGYLDFNTKTYRGPNLSNTTMYNNRVMQVNTLVCGAFNFDFDGDNMSIYSIHSQQAKKSFFEGFLGNPQNLKYEHTGGLVANPEHEAVYAFWALTEKVQDVIIPQDINVDTLPVFDLENNFVDARILNKNPGQLVKYISHDIEDYVILPYNIAAINKAAGKTILDYNPGAVPKKVSKKLITKLLDIVGPQDFYMYLHELNKFLLMCSTLVGYCNPTFSARDFAITSDNIIDYKETLINEPFIGFHQNDILFTEYVKPEIAKDKMNSLHRVSESDARIKSVQLLKAASNNGIPTDIHGRAFINNIKQDLLSGHTKEGFFQSGDSARLALAQRQEAIPRGGELQRRFFWITGFLKLAKVDDCGTKKTFPIFIRNEDHLKTLDGRWYKVENSQIEIHNPNHVLKKNNLKTIDINSEESKSLIGTYVNFRNPFYCEQSGYKICDKCMGTKQTKSINLGAAIGSYIPEAIIQSVLRTHHFSGAFITKIRKEILELIKRNRFRSPNYIYFKDLNDLQLLKEFYNEVYDSPDDINIIPVPEENTGTESCYRIDVINPPFNDDSVKQLNKIIQILDKDRNEENMMPLEEMYNQLLDEIVLPNGIYSIFIELIMSLMYYDENDTIIRYGGEPHHQTALKKIIQKCDPRLSIFYNLNPNAIALILRDDHKILGAQHMLSGLITPYKK